MKLLSLNKIIYYIIFTLILYQPSFAEDAVDIWKKNKQKKIVSEKNVKNKKTVESTINSTLNSSDINKEKIEIQNTILSNSSEDKMYGLFDPDQNNFTLSMWSNSKGSEVVNSLKRIAKLNLSKTAEDIFKKTLLSYSFPPENLDVDEFLQHKVDWMIANEKIELLENFLKKNNNFSNKKKIIQYLVDKNISSSNIKKGCEKANFISQDIKEPYLEKFKIYCLVFNNKKNQAQLLHDILKEQGKSDIFFDDKINYLTEVTSKTDQLIREDNLLNFYLSSITIKNFNYEPNKKTKLSIWEYLNSANLIKFDKIKDKEKIKNFETAANENRLEKVKIFEIYKNIPFDLITLINAQNIYQTKENIESRALIYQKYLLSDNTENQIKLLFLLKDLFNKDKILNIYSEFLSEKLKKINKADIPSNYVRAVENNILPEIQSRKGRIKFDDKILHKSRVVRFYVEPGTPQAKTQKDLDSVYKKIKRNKNYFFSAKDLALVESLKIDGLKIPKEIDIIKSAKKYDVPANLMGLIKNKESGFLALKIVEIIGQDEIYNLDPETIYFITHLLNQMGLYKFRNEIIISTLPLRV